MRSILFLALFFVGLEASAQSQEPLTTGEQSLTIDSLIQSLQANYVFPEVAQKMGQHLQQQLKAGAYQQLNNPVAFADKLTEDLQAISHDLHLRVRFNPEDAQQMRAQSDSGEPEGPDEQWLKEMRRDNFGFQEAKILEGNIGYLDLRGFYPAEFAGETAAAVMNMLSNTDGIIFDLRQNGGGDPGMIQLLTSYLYDARDQIHLNSFYFRPTDDTTQTWTLPYVPGKRNPKAEVFVLTSGRTFSAAEEFTYNLKNLKRGTIVGETTGGGAHPGGMRPIGNRFVAFVPSGRAINPITHTNWEGTGVSPDIEVKQENALEVAHQMALEKLAEKATAEEDKAFFNWYANYLKAKSDPITLSKEQMEACTGAFGARSILMQDGQLYYQRDKRTPMALEILSATSFSLKGDASIRLSVEMKDGQAAALVMESISGWQERTERSDVKP
ncbi:MAG: S41 family peptidase [Lewinellaceae bacterium]|nr:S41 family peptidase [Lewinellaceae bacterium]